MDLHIALFHMHFSKYTLRPLVKKKIKKKQLQMLLRGTSSVKQRQKGACIVVWRPLTFTAGGITKQMQCRQMQQLQSVPRLWLQPTQKLDTFHCTSTIVSLGQQGDLIVVVKQLTIACSILLSIATTLAPEALQKTKKQDIRAQFRHCSSKQALSARHLS